MPGTWRVPVSLQSHSRAPPGKTLASLKGEKPSTSMRPQARCTMRGDFGSAWPISASETKRESPVIVTGASPVMRFPSSFSRESAERRTYESGNSRARLRQAKISSGCCPNITPAPGARFAATLPKRSRWTCRAPALSTLWSLQSSYRDPSRGIEEKKSIMAVKRDESSVSYRDIDVGYFEDRQLRRHAGVFYLWALGVAAVISGAFSGWNLGFAVGGWGGMLLGAILITLMYLGLTYSIAEMSPALPHTGGAYSFARTAFGPWAGYITGVAENVEYVLTPAVIVFFIGAYLTAIFDTPAAYQPIWLAAGYALFV